MFSFLRHFIATKGPLHAVERLGEVICRFSRGGRRLDRVTDLLERIPVKMTFFVSAGVLARHRQRIMRLRELGHDIASHGVYHTRMDLHDHDHQLRLLQDSHGIFDQAGFDVNGFRSPYLNFNEDTRRAFAESPFRWTSGDVIFWNETFGINNGLSRLDSLTHYLLWGKRLSLPTLRDGKVDIPVSAPDDEILYERYRIRDSERLCEAWKGVFRHVHAEGELFHLLFHPERFARIQPALASLLDSVRAQGSGVWTPTLNELAAWWTRRSAWRWERVGEGRIRIDAPPEATVLLRDPAIKPQSGCVYGDYCVQPPASTYPAFTIGLSPRCPTSLEEFLHSEGFPAERADSAGSHSVFLDRPDFSAAAARSLLADLDRAERPLLRLWRWPSAHRAAFCISADICAVDLRDFVDRTLHF